MPCEYSVVELREKERQREGEKKQEEERKRDEAARKKRALLTALTALGFDLDLTSVNNRQTLIIGTKED